MGLRAEVIKLAEPLYSLQQDFYRHAGLQIGSYEQDQHLLTTIAASCVGFNPPRSSMLSNGASRQARRYHHQR